MPPHLGPSAGLLACALSAFALPGCGPSADDPLPPETDLYAYSLAVVSRARLRVPSEETRARFLEGRVHERFGFDEKALEIYARVVKESPDFFEAHQRMGYILSQKKDRMHQAIEAYQSVLRSNPGAQGVYSRLGLVFMHLGRFEDAHLALDEEIRAGTDDAETHYFKGQTHALEGKHSEAVESYRKTLASSPEHRMAQYGLAQSLKILGRAEEEKAALEKFQEFKKKEDDAGKASRKETGGDDRQKRSLASETWLDVSDVYLRGASRTQDARERSDLLGRFLQGVETAIRLDPGSPEPRQLLVTHLQKTGELERAAIACEAALRAIPRDAGLAQFAYEFAGGILEDEKSRARVDLAYRALSAAVESLPDHADARRELARLILFKLEKPDLVPKAIEHARRAVELRPDPANYDVLAYAYFRSGRGQEAAAALEEGARKNPQDETLRDRLRRLRESASGDAQGSAPRHAGGESGAP